MRNIEMANKDESCTLTNIVQADFW